MTLQVLVAKPQLAAFTGLHATSSPLHRAATAGHLSTCKAIVEAVRKKAETVEADVASGKSKQRLAKRWHSLLHTVLNQQNNRGQTALMLACERGHTHVVDFLLAQGADPLLMDAFHCRTALHYAALGGHAQCIQLLCSDDTTIDVDGVHRPLRDVVLPDLQVKSAKFVDMRSIGGLTPLHFAVVSGKLDAVQGLLQSGASIMVKTEGEAFVGDDVLTPGSTPLHLAVLTNSLPMAHALLQAHGELMNATGGSLDERRRRPWEGHSRTDIRSMRNSQRKLPYHLARSRGYTQLMQLVDPRIAMDTSLDAARDTEHGIGPKRLITLCSLVLQQSLLQWLDDHQQELEAKQQRVSGLAEPAGHEDSSLRGEKTLDGSATPVVQSTPFASAAMTITMTAEDEDDHNKGDKTPVRKSRVLIPAASAPVTPRTDSTTVANLRSAPSTMPSIPSQAVASPSRMGSLHAYVGMLSVKRSVTPQETGRGRVGEEQSNRSVQRSDQSTHKRRLTIDGLDAMIQRRVASMQRALSTGALHQLGVGGDGNISLSVVAGPPSPISSSASHSLGPSQQSPAVKRALRNFRDCLIVPDDGLVESELFQRSKDEGCEELHDNSDTDISRRDSCGHDSRADAECGVCLDRRVEVAFAGCDHMLCLDCARNLTQMEKKPPYCPFCRRMVLGFRKAQE